MVDVINLPSLPGLPDVNLANPATLPAGIGEAMTADAPGVLSALGSAIWGVFSGLTPVVVADTVVEVDYAKASNISSYPVESGGFAAYDKQATPFEGKIRFASGGSASARQALLESIEAVADDTNLYTVITPDRIYDNANLTKLEYSRSNQAGGASLLTVDVSVEEVRIVDAPIGSPDTTLDPASANAVNSGIVQPVAPPSSIVVPSLLSLQMNPPSFTINGSLGPLGFGVGAASPLQLLTGLPATLISNVVR